MNLVFQFLYDYYQKEVFSTSALVISVIAVSLIQSTGLSSVIAKIIDNVEHNNLKNSETQLKYFTGLTAIYLVFAYIQTYAQDVLLSKLRPTLRNNFMDYLMKKNNENMSNENFMKLYPPVMQSINNSHWLSFIIFYHVIPNILFFLVITCYFIYTYPNLGILFVFMNLVIITYLSLRWPRYLEEMNNYATVFDTTDFYTLEMLNNIDRIIYRGETISEAARFKDITDNLKDAAFKYYRIIDNDVDMLYVVVNMIIIVFMYISIHGVFSKNIDKTTFITFISIIIMYRDKTDTMLEQVSEFVEFYTRISLVKKHFVQFDTEDVGGLVVDPIISASKLPFQHVSFNDLTFTYKSEKVFDRFNLELNTSGNTIIGFVGKSGKGKSTLIKLLLKMYGGYTGEILIDGISIRDLSADDIRKNITYVNQNSKLFDKKVIDNIFYGCQNDEECKKHLTNILAKYPKISELFKSIDIYNKSAGSLGENLSGGQRQIVNIVGGLVNPSKILVLDEPTNALDGELKSEVLSMVRDYRVHKQCIMIITHDRDVYSLFDRRVDL